MSTMYPSCIQDQFMPRHRFPLLSKAILTTTHKSTHKCKIPSRSNRSSLRIRQNRRSKTLGSSRWRQRNQEICPTQSKDETSHDRKTSATSGVSYPTI